jgi:Cadherin domain
LIIIVDILIFSGVISVRKSLSGIKSDEDFAIKVTISDHGKPILTSSRVYSVRLERSNTHTPIFDFDNNEISVSENTPLNTEIITLAAIDNDDGPSGEVLYSIVDGEKQKFGVFPDGRVYLKEYLDRETKAYYAVTVLASDKGIPPRSSTATVVIYVADENDNSPILLSDNDVVYVEENSSAETVVGRVSASDADIGRNAELTYTFSNGMTSDNFLRVDPRTGVDAISYSLFFVAVAPCK